MVKVEIDKNKVLVPGDRIEMHFKTSGLVWLQAAQIALIEERVKNRSDWQIISNSLPANNRVIFTIEIIQPPEPGLQRAGVGVTAAIIGTVIVAAGVVSWLTLDKVEQIMESPAGQVAVAGSGVGMAALGIAALLYFARK